ncbi:MAG: universal stress protein [candidate division WOR-3 bacterium]
MRLNRLLLFLNDAPPPVLDFTLELAEKFSAKIFALYIIDENLVREKMKRENKKREVVKDELEEIAWKKLYEAEDLSARKGVKTSLLLLEGKVNQILREVMESYEIDFLILSRERQLNWERLLEINKGIIIL